MPRNISFMLTQEQVKNKTKTVTRRNGWRFLKVGEILNGVEKCPGLKKGEKMIRICQIRVTKVSLEPLYKITPAELIKEGFPEMTPPQFIDMFCKSHKGVTPYSEITRIEFEYICEHNNKQYLISYDADFCQDCKKFIN